MVTATNTLMILSPLCFAIDGLSTLIYWFSIRGCQMNLPLALLTFMSLGLCRILTKKLFQRETLKGPVFEEIIKLACIASFGLAHGTGWPLTLSKWTLMISLVLFSMLFIGFFKDWLNKIEFQKEGVGFIFAVSGMAALIYQVVWQRCLYTYFGINQESVTLIVSVFMLGLGGGSLVGGALYRKFPNASLRIFAWVEMGTAAFGIVSLKLMQLAGEHLSGTGLGTVAGIFLLLLPPTFLMGSTLPLLVNALKERYCGLENSLRYLYAVNTFGAAIAALVSVFVLFVWMGLQAAVYLAAGLNILVALLALRQAKGSVFKGSTEFQEAPETSALPWGWLIISALGGFVALSQEIIWYRILGFIGCGMPISFGLMLGFYLMGLALGAYKIGDVSSQGIRVKVFHWVLSGTALFYFSLVLLSFGAPYFKMLGTLVLGCLLVFIVAYYGGGVLPGLFTLAKSSNTWAVSAIYGANILGSTAGAFLTGFYFLEWMTTIQTIALVSGLGFVLAIILADSWRRRILCVILLVMGCAFVEPINKDVWPKLLFAYPGAQNYACRQFEGRGGILSLVQYPGGEVVYGNGVYDGRMNLDPVIDSNIISRIYKIALLHKAPKNFLVIGLSGGPWVKVLSSYTPIQQMDVIELNRACEKVIRSTPLVADILDNLKIRYYWDDGRRYVKAHEDKYDFILMNASFHWRAYSTNTNSQEFFQLMKSRLNPAGVFYFNTTHSANIEATVRSVFPYTVIIGSFIAASETPFQLSEEQKRANILSFIVDSKPYFLSSPALASKMEEMIAFPLTPSVREGNVITDDNVYDEYKRSR